MPGSDASEGCVKADAKPLGAKAYGSTPHLPGSRMGPADHHCHEGQDRICTATARDRHDRVIVSEKLDGSCVSVARLGDGSLVALGRAGYLAQSSRFEQHQLFAAWVRTNEWRFAGIGNSERLVGEWLAQAHGTRYALAHEPFVPFALFLDSGKRRACWDLMADTVRAGGLVTPRVLHAGAPVSVEAIIDRLEPSGHGALDPVEGAVWLVERKGVFDFLAKWVRSDKKDGCLLPEMTGRPAVWNWRPLLAEAA